MSANKKYYYLKLKEDYFDSDEMIILESMKDGYKYSNILMKLYLRSLKNEGRLMFNNRIPFNSEMLANVTRHSVGDIERAMQIFKELELIEVLDSGAIYITDIQNFVGKSSTEADRKRAYRSRIDSEKKALPKGLNAPSDKCPDKSPPEIEIELELELEKELKKETKNIPFQEIIDYLNLKAKKPKGFKVTENRKRNIRQRFRENYTLDDFKYVIEVKTQEWLGNDEMERHLNPETLFSLKHFDKYLNQKKVKKTKGNNPFSKDYDNADRYSGKVKEKKELTDSEIKQLENEWQELGF